MTPLVVKRAALGSYRRVLIAVDLDAHAGAVIAAAAALSRDTAMEVLHVLGTRDKLPMRVSDVPELALRQLRRHALQRSRHQLEACVAAAGAPGTQPLVAFGEAGATVLARAQARRAELVVLGKQQRGLLADFLLGSVTQRVLAGSPADVLVLPVAGKGSRAGVQNAGVDRCAARTQPT